MTQKAQAGRSGSARSDCMVTIERRGQGGVSITLRSKVKALYGKSIRALVNEMLTLYALDNVDVLIEDAGALPYTIAARVETAIRRLQPDTDTEFLLPFRDGIRTTSSRDRLRRSRLYLPGNDPKLAINAGIHGADGIILDLEDSVAPAEKDAARILVRNTLREVDFMGAERMVRINQGETGLHDLDMIIPQAPNLVLIPKVESAGEVLAVHELIDSLRSDAGLVEEIFLMPIIESAKGALFAWEIATAAPSVVALAVGLEDYTADIGAERTLEGKESFWMRGAILNAAKAAGVQAIDTVFSDVGDMDGLLASVREARALGFDGKGCIHPRQIAVVHEGFLPEAAQLEKARRIVLAFDDAQRRGLGVVALGSKMIDPPVVARAMRSIELAVRAGVLALNWKEEASDV
jgi:citrate lyase subunit beta / citryl-CoA lyase